MRAVPTVKTVAPLQIIQFILDPLGYMTANSKRYGDMFKVSGLWGGKDPLVLVSDPKAVQYLLTHDAGKEFTAPGDINQLLEPLIGRQNLLLLSGSQHRSRRQFVMPPFHGERLQSYGQIIQNISQDVIVQWPVHEPFNARSAMQKITMRVILQVVFGLHQGDRYNQLDRLLTQRLEMTSTPLSSAIIFLPWLQKDYGPWSPGHRIGKLAEEIDKLLFAEIQERRANPDPDRIDILSLLLAAKDEDGNGLTDQDLRDELMTLLVAGHETTATALTWAIYWIHSLPDVKQKLLAELDSVPDPKDPAQFLQLPYLTAVCSETLRIYPVAMLTFPRRVEVPLELCGYQLEPGMLLMGSIYLIHQREELYPQPQQFRPERFLERQFSPYEFLPFGGGVRRCIGAALAQYEMKIVLGTILTQVHLALVNKLPVEPGRRGLTLGQKTPVQVQKLGMRSASKMLVEV
jgi:cytochrome P450